MPVPRAEQFPSHTYKTLDGIRGVAAVSVFGWHFAELFGAKPASGFLAVDLFFCLSGYVLSYAYGRRLEQEQITLRRFMTVRLIRLYPLYILGLLCMILSVMVAVTFHLPTNWNVGQIAIATTFSMFFLPTPPLHSDAVFPLNNPAWSLFFELLVNLCYAIFAPKLNVRALIVVVVISGIALTVGAIHYDSWDVGSKWPTFFMGIPRVSYSFFLGVLLRRTRLNLDAGSLPVLLVTALMLCADPGKYSIEYGAIALLIGVPLIVAAGANSEPPALLLPAYGFLGLTSYALYVLQIPVMAGTMGLLKKIVGQFYAPVSGLTCLSALMLLCYVLDKRFDLPVRKYLSGRMITETSA